MQELTEREAVALCSYTGAKTPEKALELAIETTLDDAVEHLDWVQHEEYRKARLALTKWRESADFFVDPDQEVEGMHRNLPVEKKIELIYQQIERETRSLAQLEEME